MSSVGFTQANLVGTDEHESNFVNTAPSGSPEHLQNFIRPERVFDVVAPIGFAGDGHAAQREVNPGRKAHGGDDHSKLASLGQRFNNASAGGIAQSAVVIGNPALEN